MDITNISIQLASSDPARLKAFYRDVIGLTPQPEMGDGSFSLGPAGTLFIVDHSEVSGPTKEPARALIDLHISDIDAEHARLEAAGVKFSRSKGVEFWGGVISTFADPDGNRIQLMQFKPELAREEA
jgi:predicted enzyme related to lactoylglutathione lyase